MRRLAKQSREDKVASARDYQTIQERQGVALELDPSRACHAIFVAKLVAPGNVPFVGAGAYFRVDTDAEIAVSLVLDADNGVTELHQARTTWQRFGIAIEGEATGTVRLEIDTSGGVGRLDVWGLDCGALTLPQGIIDSGEATVATLVSPHLSPETLYLPHEVAVAMDPVVEDWDGFRSLDGAGATINVKKCAYCQRYLPIDRDRPSALAFHKHNAKVSGHQNECRACKKWRINDSFNPKRTTDQLHESSVITRERKFFLREPEILQRIKDREGAGLKSIIWKRFGKRCFRCQRDLKVSEVQLDHTRPLAYLWPIDEHATCLCGECNNHKRERFPVEVYSEPQLRELAGITGLAYDELVKKELNPAELARLQAEIKSFAREWDARTFNACARKVREMRPDLDLFEVLRCADATLAAELVERLAERPGGEEE